VYLDAIQLKLRRDSKGLHTAGSIVVGVDRDGQRAGLGHGGGAGADGANFWRTVVTDLQTRGVEDSFIAGSDGLTGCKDAIQAVFPQTQIQRCIIHQVRQSLSSVSWKDRPACVADLKAIYQAPPREAAALKLLELGERWGDTSAVAVRAWEKHGEDLATLFDSPAEIRRLIYPTNTVEGDNRQVRKVGQTKGAFPRGEAARKLLYLATRDSTKTWTAPISTWAKIRNQLAIRFEGRFPL
jgi:putative transposase